MFGVSPEAVWAIISGATHEPRLAALAGLLQGTINLDTLDGIMRVARDFRLRRPKLPASVFARGENGEIVMRADAVAGMDAFWRLKDRVYDRIINLPSNILAEARLCELVQSELDDDGLFDRFEEFDDEAFAQRLGQMAGGLDPGDLVLDEDGDYELRSAAGWGQVLRRTRKRYFVAHSDGVSPEHDLPSERWPTRYRHRREAAFLVSRRRQLALPGMEPARALLAPVEDLDGPQI